MRNSLTIPSPCVTSKDGWVLAFVRQENQNTFFAFFAMMVAESFAVSAVAADVDVYRTLGNGIASFRILGFTRDIPPVLHRVWMTDPRM